MLLCNRFTIHRLCKRNFLHARRKRHLSRKHASQRHPHFLNLHVVEACRAIPRFLWQSNRRIQCTPAANSFLTNRLFPKQRKRASQDAYRAQSRTKQASATSNEDTMIWKVGLQPTTSPAEGSVVKRTQTVWLILTTTKDGCLPSWRWRSILILFHLLWNLGVFSSSPNAFHSIAKGKNPSKRRRSNCMDLNRQQQTRKSFRTEYRLTVSPYFLLQTSSFFRDETR